MGGSLSFAANADSISTPGKKSVVSDPIDGVDKAKLLDAIQKYVRAGKTANGYEAEPPTVEDCDGGVLVLQHYKIPDLLGGGDIKMRTIFKFNDDGATLISYPTDSFWRRKEAASESRIVVHPDSKVEYWADVFPTRASGRIMKTMVDKVVESIGSKAGCKEDCDSISEPGKTSVVTDAIEDSEVKPEDFLESFKNWLIEQQQATALPDGTIVEERGGMGEVVGLGIKTFAKHEFKKEENKVCCYEYGEDETMTDIVSVTYLQVHKEPFRLEQWNVPIPGRRAGPPEQKIIEPFIKGVLKDLSEGA